MTGTKNSPAAKVDGVPDPVATRHGGRGFAKYAFCLGFATAIAAVGVTIPALPLIVGHRHVVAAMTPETLPPKAAFSSIIQLLDGLDTVVRTTTPPNLYLFRQLMGYLHTVQIYTTAELSVADAIHAAGGGPVPIESLARAVVPECTTAAGEAASCPQVALRLQRVLRATAAYGIFAESSPSAWSNTPASEHLRADHPHSMRSAALMFGRVQFKMMAALPDTIRGGVASFQHVYGDEFWHWYEAHSNEHAIFDSTMLQLGKIGGADAAIANDFAFGAVVDTLVDVGGGFGDMLTTILRAHPSLRGVIFDIPPVIARAESLWTTDRPGVPRARVTLQAGDMFSPETLPSPVHQLAAHVREAVAAGQPIAPGTCTHSTGGAYGYVLRDIVHDWNDEDTVRIMTSIRQVMRGANTTCYGADGAPLPPVPAPAGSAHRDKLLLVARVIRPGANFVQTFGTNDADIVMLGAFGTTAGERTLEHFERLLAASGLRVEAVTPTRSHYFVIQAVAA